MKKFALFTTLLVFISGTLVYLSPPLQHKIYFSLPKNIQQQLDRLGAEILSTKTKPLYKWKDNKGQWIVSDTPPKNGTNYETLQYNPDANVIPAEALTGKTDKK